MARVRAGEISEGFRLPSKSRTTGSHTSESGRGGRPSLSGMSSMPETAAGTNSLPQLKLRALKPVLLPYRAPGSPASRILKPGFC